MYQARDAIINRINPEVNQVIDLEKFLQATANELGRLMGVERCNLLIVSSTGELTIGYEYRSDPSIPSMLRMKIPIDLRTVNAKIDLRRPIAVNDTSALSLDPVISKIVEMTQTQSLLIVPVVLKSELMGLIGLHYCKAQHNWQLEQVEFVESIARQVAIGYEYTRLYTEKEKEAKITTALLEIANEINAGGDFIMVTQSVIDKALNLIGADFGCIGILDAKGNSLRFDIFRGQGGEPLTDMVFNLDKEPHVRSMFARDNVLRLEDPTRDGTSAFLLRHLFIGARSALVIPILIKERAFGTLNLVWNHEPRIFTTYETELVAGIGNQIAIALERDQLSAEVVRLQEELKGAKAPQPIIGVSDKIKACIEMALHVATSDATVLLQGESGTGKELIANMIYLNSRRVNQPFVKINCGALPETLLETELFGHERGAFTDAHFRRIGKFEEADGGTLFLDEIGEMSPNAQVKLLRVLQDGEFTRIGGNQSIKTDVRIIASTNVDLSEAVNAGRFRRDLFYRLNVYPLHLPPLRERREDVYPLVLHFIEVHKKKTGRLITGITDKALQLLKGYDWPGNVRELENAIERSVIVVSGRMITVDDLPEVVRRGYSENLRPTLEVELGTALEEVEKRVILETLIYTQGDKTKAARLLGIGRKTLYRKLAQYQSVEIKAAGQSASVGRRRE
jgi:two-component system response regulator HydG